MAETYYSLTEIVKLCDNLVAAMPTSFYSGIMAVRTGLANIPAADVVARDCYDRLLAENDELRKERPVRHGRWKLGICQECLFDWSEVSLFANVPKYCPNCGALMDKDGYENEIE